MPQLKEQELSLLELKVLAAETFILQMSQSVLSPSSQPKMFLKILALVVQELVLNIKGSINRNALELQL